MFQLILQKLKTKKGMVASLLLGTILLVSVVCCNIIYTRASLQRMINTGFSDYLDEHGSYPMLYSMQSILTVNGGKVQNLPIYDTCKEIWSGVEELFGIPAAMQIRHDQLSKPLTVMDLPRSAAQASARLYLGSISDLERHVKMVTGTYPSASLVDGYIEVMISEQMMYTQSIVIGDTFTAIHDEGEEPEYRLKVVGIYTSNKEISDGYWVLSPNALNAEFLMNRELFDNTYGVEPPQYPLRTMWYCLLDYSKVTPENTEHIITTSEQLTKLHSETKFREFFSPILQSYKVNAVKVRTTLWVLQVPVFVLLGLFIYMVARQLLELEQSEISVMKSRGASREQIIQTYLLQSGLTSAAGFLIGLPLAFILCQIVGSANAFLEFVSRSALPVRLNGTVLAAGLGTAVFAIIVMVVPAFHYADITIVAQKQHKTRGNQAPWWQRFFLDFLLLGISLYGLYSFNHQKDALAAAVADGAQLDPLLFLSSSLFIMGAGLVSLRIVPFISRLVYRFGKERWSPALYSSFLRIIRTRYRQGFIMLFLIVTVALGIFNAKAARTINQNEEKRIRYEIGADVALAEDWQTNSFEGEDNPSAIVYYEPDFDRFRVMDHVVSATRVYIEKDAAVTSEKLTSVQLMGIHTREFGETAYMEDGLLPEHWYNYLNRMAADAQNIIVSRNFQTNFGYEIGDALVYRGQSGTMQRGIISDFVEYWPGYNPYDFRRGSDGLYSQTERYLVVAHLSTVQAAFGMRPYQVWIRTDGSTDALYDAMAEGKLTVRDFRDASDEIIRIRNNPVFQGTSGSLTVSFIVVLLLCIVGFLIYWILSIQSRALQFGIFRAMGMSLKEILTGLVNEQVFITGLSLIAGTGIGLLAAKLYVPLIMISYASYDQPLPLQIAQAGGDITRLFVLILLTIAACLGILWMIISRIHISQALKLGED